MFTTFPRALLLLFAFLLACGKKEEPASAHAAAPTKPAEAALKIAFAYVGPVGDAGWTFAHDRGRKAIEAAQVVRPAVRLVAIHVREQLDASLVVAQCLL